MSGRTKKVRIALVDVICLIIGYAERLVVQHRLF
jgi:hypothetical protein